MRLKVDAVRMNFSDFSQTEHLETATVRKDGPLPVHKAVQPAGLGNHVHSRTNRQMIRVAEDHLGAAFHQLAIVERLDAGLRSDRHEGRCFNNAPSRLQAA